MQILLFGAGYKYSYLIIYFVEYSIRYSTEYSSSKKLDSHTLTHKSTFGLLEFITEQGHRVNWVFGSLDSRVVGSQNVTQFLLWPVIVIT